ncbi:MAG: TMEM43 family protein [Verrucomicrobiota bacterium]
MASKKKNSKLAGILIGPVLVGAAVIGLWKNETRFDYHKAATRTTPVTALDDFRDTGESISYTGEMDQSLSFAGKYIETFTGYLVVNRDAEIYCWDRDEDEDGDVTWRKTWMNSVQSNSRNNGIRQELSSGRILPSSYEVDDLMVESQAIEFVDSRVQVDPGPLPRTKEGARLVESGNYLILSKDRSDNLGDERLSFRAIPVPPVATWFGRLEGDTGVADTAEQKSGFINSLIRNTGILHHLVGGERQAALATMKRHIERLKWIVRAIGTVLVVFGFLFFLSTVLRFLYAIPLIGGVAEKGVFLLSVALGVPLAFTTIVLGYIAGNPLLLTVLVTLLIAVIGYLLVAAKRRRASGSQIRKELESERGETLEADALKRMEYQEMTSLLSSRSGEIGESESKVLHRFAKQRGWGEAERDALTEAAQANAPEEDSREAHLKNLVRLALADDVLTPQEVRSIREAAELAGYDRKQFRKLMASCVAST